jgi:SAM-dependent methyltransferase
VHIEQGDAQRLPFRAGQFDVVLSQLVLNFVPDRAKALIEMRRVARPGGTIAAAVWDYADGMQSLRAFWDEAIALRPEMEARDERHMPLCREGELAAFWREHGMRQVADAPLTIPTRFASFDDYWQPFLDGQGPAGAFVAGLDAPDRDALRQRLLQRLSGGDPARPIALTARAWAVRGSV